MWIKETLFARALHRVMTAALPLANVALADQVNDPNSEVSLDVRARDLAGNVGTRQLPWLWIASDRR